MGEPGSPFLWRTTFKMKCAKRISVDELGIHYYTFIMNNSYHKSKRNRMWKNLSRAPKPGFRHWGEHQFWDPQARRRITWELKLEQPRGARSSFFVRRWRCVSSTIVETFFWGVVRLRAIRSRGDVVPVPSCVLIRTLQYTISPLVLSLSLSLVYPFLLRVHIYVSYGGVAKLSRITDRKGVSQSVAIFWVVWNLCAISRRRKKYIEHMNTSRSVCSLHF